MRILDPGWKNSDLGLKSPIRITGASSVIMYETISFCSALLSAWLGSAIQYYSVHNHVHYS
jgi:hypothetical protein